MTRRYHHARLAIIVAGLALAAANPVHAATRLPSCTAHPGSVTLTTGGQVRAGHVRVTCAGSWVVHESVMWAADDSAKWIFGGDRTVHGQGDTTIPAFRRGYHECGYWKLRATIRGVGNTDGPVTEFCNA